MGTFVHIRSLAASFPVGLNFGGTPTIAEPLSLVLLGIALVGLGIAVRKKFGRKTI